MDAGLSQAGASMSECAERCAVCRRGRYRAQTITWFDADVDRPAMVLSVPARVCDWCGDETISSAIAEALDRIARERPGPARTIKVPVYDLAAVPAGRT
jgi:hypothetical protein